jgi:hypothetical protein
MASFPIFPTWSISWTLSLLELVKKMVDKHGNAHPQIRDAMDELRVVHSRDMDQGLCDKALLALGQIPLPMDSTA